ncbi:uncharacterized protein [Macrobrachium rosenbergii]|uniref:uncharacterized protein isoform X2 n=1 Tax=Macrobrachium rosenbergii TaxID=79674 RepID=UPI0034D4ED1A
MDNEFDAQLSVDLRAEKNCFKFHWSVSSLEPFEGQQNPKMSFLIRTFLLLLVACSLARATCPESDQIHCKNSDRCTRIRYICDGDNDCGDNSDEDSTLCRYWRNSDCERNNARCTRNGRSDCITISHYCGLTDPPCEGSVDPRLCQMLKDEKIQDIDSIVLETPATAPTVSLTTAPSVFYSAEDFHEDFKRQLDLTIRHKDCPQLYTRIGDQCVSVFFIGNLTWLESQAFCQAIGGELFVVKSDLSNYIALLQHFNDNQVTKDFWIGGMYVNSSTGWQWTDERSIQLGAPIWAVRHTPVCSTRVVTSPSFNVTREANDGICYHYKQAPSEPLTGHCLAITYEHYYFASDQECWTRKSPLCVTPDEHPKQAY